MEDQQGLRIHRLWVGRHILPEAGQLVEHTLPKVTALLRLENH